MNMQFKEAAEREVNKAIAADEQANAHYYQTLKLYVVDRPTTPKAKLDSAGLKTIDVAWIKLNNTSKNLRRAYMKLYKAYL
jgi:hypothetical protein